MTRDSRLLLLLLLILLMASGLFLVEARHRPREETAADARHRHRHRHDSSATARRNRHDLADRRGASWSQELDYEDDSLADRETEERADEEEDDYDARPYYERSYPRTSAKIPVHGRTFESRYPSRLHRGGYRGTGWHDRTAGDEDRDEERRRASSSRHGGRGYRARTHRRPGHSRSRDRESDEDDFDRVYGEDASPEKQRSWGRKYGRKHSLGAPRRDWRFDARRRHRFEDLHPGPRLDEWRRRRFDLTESKFPGKSEGKRTENSNDYEYPSADDLDDEEEDEDDDDDDDDDDDGDDDLVWKEMDDKNRGDDDEELNNDFYKSEGKPPLKTYDDIIRRLTSNDPTTGRPTVRRDYRNTESERYAKREPYGSFKYEPRNFSRPLIHERGKIVSLPAYRPAPKKFVDATSGKLSGSMVERKPTRNASVDRPEKKATGDDARPKTKSLEQDYDEYLNTPDNEKEEDLVKAGVDEDSAMQADVTNTDYTEDEDEGETPATRSAPTTTTTTTTTSTTTTTTTTTTPRPVVAKSYDYRDPRSSEGQTGAQYNGYQSKNDYPPMSAHSVHKWQSLGTREGVKEARSNMQQYNKNGKSAEILEALQHAIKVSREGSCQWPRPRVIPVRDVYPSPSTTYIPHCAILHRCSDDTGCCRSEALTCVPKHSHRVELSFYTANVGGGSVVEKLSFYNHTECECRERSEYETSNEKPSEPRISRHHHPSSPQPQNMRRAQPRKPCRCPSEFTPRMTSEGECQCTCYENDQNCIKIKRGKGYFSLADRLCIQNDACAPPSCEFGDYMRRQGKCPRKKDKFDAIANYHTNLSYRYRS